MPSTELLGAMGRYAGDMHAAGVLLGGEGLQPSSGGKKVKFENGKPVIIGGPFAETKESRQHKSNAVRHHPQRLQSRWAFEELTIGATQCVSW